MKMTIHSKGSRLNLQGEGWRIIVDAEVLFSEVAEGLSDDEAGLIARPFCTPWVLHNAPVEAWIRPPRLMGRPNHPPDEITTFHTAPLSSIYDETNAKRIRRVHAACWYVEEGTRYGILLPSQILFATNPSHTVFDTDRILIYENGGFR